MSKRKYEIQAQICWEGQSYHEGALYRERYALADVDLDTTVRELVESTSQYRSLVERSKRDDSIERIFSGRRIELRVAEMEVKNE